MVKRLKTTEINLNLNKLAEFAYSGTPVEFLPDATSATVQIGSRVGKIILETLDKMASYLNMSRSQLIAFMVEDALITLCQKILIEEHRERPEDVIFLDSQVLYDETFAVLEASSKTHGEV